MPFSSYHDPAEDSPKIRPDYVIKLFNDSETSTDQVKAAHVTSLTKSKRRLIQKVTFIQNIESKKWSALLKMQSIQLGKCTGCVINLLL